MKIIGKRLVRSVIIGSSAPEVRPYRIRRTDVMLGQKSRRRAGLRRTNIKIK